MELEPRRFRLLQIATFPFAEVRFPSSILQNKALPSSKAEEGHELKTCPFFARMMYTAAEGSPPVRF